MKLTYIVSLLLLFIACKKAATSSSDVASKQNTSTTITESDISKMKFTEFVLSQETKTVVESWTEYAQLQEQVGYVKKGDLSYFNDNKKSIETLLKGLKDNIPETFSNNSILARIKIVETSIYKLESLVRLSTTTKPELMDGIKAFLIAISNLDNQLNKVIEHERNNSIPKP